MPSPLFHVEPDQLEKGRLWPLTLLAFSGLAVWGFALWGFITFLKAIAHKLEGLL